MMFDKSIDFLVRMPDSKNKKDCERYQIEMMIEEAQKVIVKYSFNFTTWNVDTCSTEVLSADLITFLREDKSLSYLLKEPAFILRNFINENFFRI